MRLYKKKNSPHWWMDVTVNGTRYRKSTKRLFKDRNLAVQTMNDFYNRKLNEAQFGQKPRITLSEACDAIVESAEKPKTRKSYDLSRRKLLGLYKPDQIWHLDPNMYLDELTQIHVNKLSLKRRGEGLKNNSINIEIRFLRAVYYSHTKTHQVTADLEFRELNKFVRKRYFSYSQEKEVLRRLEAKECYPAYKKAKRLFIYLLDTGVRLEEALEQDWYNIDMENRTLLTYQPKTDSYAPQPMTERVASALEEVRDQASPFEAMSRALKVLRRVVDEVCNQDQRQVERLGKMVLHSCRDTFVTRLNEGGMGLEQIGKMVGHGSVATSQKYSHLDRTKIVNEAREIMNQHPSGQLARF